MTSTGAKIGFSAGLLGAATVAVVLRDDGMRNRLAATFLWQCKPADTAGLGPCIKTSLTAAETAALRAYATGQNVVEFDHLRKGYGNNLLIDELTFKLPAGGMKVKKKK